MINETRTIETCFVTAQAGTPLDLLRESLLAHKIRPLIPERLLSGSSWASEIQRQMIDADLVIGVLSKGKQSPNVLFELGQAWALGRRILLIAPPGTDAVPLGTERFLILRTEPDNREAIDFALDQLLSAPREPSGHEAAKPFASVGLGAQADSFISRLDHSLRSGKAEAFESVIAEAIRSSSTDVVVQSPRHDRGVDLAVWSDVLGPFVGNPLLVEIKLRVRDRESTGRIFDALSAHLGASNTGWALLLYGEGPEPDDRFWKSCPPNILLMQAVSLLEALRTRTFPEIVRDLRNRRVHSVRP